MSLEGSPGNKNSFTNESFDIQKVKLHNLDSMFEQKKVPNRDCDKSDGEEYEEMMSE
jgi:hypothetical protein